MLFRQLFDQDSSTYTYLLADEASREAVLIDAVQFERDSTAHRLRATNTQLCADGACTAR